MYDNDILILSYYNIGKYICNFHSNIKKDDISLIFIGWFYYNYLSNLLLLN
jgi:hypothetical protein